MVCIVVCALDVLCDSPRGSYQPNAGLDQCILCGVGTFGSAVGQTACLACGAGTFSKYDD